MKKIIWSLHAQNNLASIFDFIAQDSIFYAGQEIKKIVKSVEILKKLPAFGRVVPELKNPKIREILKRPYRIVYRINNDDVIEIITVFHSWRNFVFEE